MNIAGAMFFVLSLVASVIVGLFVLTYASRTFVNALDGTAAGNDDIPWPTDSFIDQLAEPFFLVYVLALGTVVVVVPVGLLFPDFLQLPAGVPLVLGGVAWLLFPILLLSALTGTSRWYVLHWEFLRRLVRHPLALVIFYVSTGASLFIGAGAAYLAIDHRNPLAVAAVLVTAACVLVHARLFGRLGWIVGQTPIYKSSAKRRRLRGVKSSDPWDTPQAERDNAPPAPAQETAFTASDPHPILEETPTATAASDAEEDEWTASKNPYAFSGDAAPPVPPPIPASQAHRVAITAASDAEEDEWTPNKKPYLFLAAAPAPPKTPLSQAQREAITASPRAGGERNEAPNMRPAAPAPPPESAGLFKPELQQPDRIEMRWQEGRKLPPLPRQPLLIGVWNFPFYQTTLGRFAALSILSFVLALMIRFMLSLRAMGGA
jgi:hypothetical protein